MPPIVVGLLVAAVSMGVFFLLGALKWIENSRPDSCVEEGSCYCESFHDAMVKQPSNTWSNFGFMIVGLVLLAGLPAAVAGSGQNAMEQRSMYSVLYGCVVIFLGPGSMFFHASMKKWGGWLDNVSMLFYTGLLLVYDFTGLVHGSKGVFWAIYLGLVVALSALAWFVPKSPLRGFSTGSLAFGAMAVVWVVLQIFALLGIGAVDRSNGPAVLLFLAALIVFGIAFFIQQHSQTGRPWCEPAAVLQGHAIWHLLTAATTVILFFYLRTEVGLH